MKSTFKVLFYLKRNAENKDGVVVIMARVTVDSKLCQFSTKLKIKPKKLECKSGQSYWSLFGDCANQ